MLTALIVDDEILIRQNLKILLKKNHAPELAVTGEAASVAEARALLQQEPVDLIFLDINMPRENGFELLADIDTTRTCVIFVTAYKQHALKALKASAVDYLLKPVDPEELAQAIDKVKKQCAGRLSDGAAMPYQEALRNLVESFQQNTTVKKITVPHIHGFKIIELDNILYLQADNNYTILHLKSGDKIVASRNLKEFEEMLEDSIFFRIHKSTIINLSYMREFSSEYGPEVIMSDGTGLMVSRRKLPEFMEQISKTTIRKTK
jgi:two-component system, LytTR family, response regulator